MSEPIYEISNGGQWVLHKATGVIRCGPWGDNIDERAAHLLKLLNADPFPEDRPKRFVVGGTSTVSWVVDTRSGRCIGDWPITYYPDHRERAEAEAAALNERFREDQ